MFEHMLREIKALERLTKIEVPLEGDADGFLDRECPAEGCLFEFKIHGDDWKSIVRDEEVFCPMCRHAANSQSWFTKLQLAAGREYVSRVIGGRIDSALRADARALNSRQRSGSLLSITAKVSGGHHLPPVPVQAEDPMRLRSACEACGCRYSFVGSAFFCPACGHNSASATFAQTIQNARRSAEVRDMFRQYLGADDADACARLLREKALSDIVTSVQRLAERVWESIPAATPPARNIFQRLDDASALWRRATGKGWDDLLSPTEFQRLKLFYQRRHVLAHCEGIIDPDYIRKSGDTDLQVGQRVVVDEASVLEFADLASRLGHGMLEFVSSPAKASAALPKPSTAPDPSSSPGPGPARMRSGLSDEAETIAKLLVETSVYGREMDPLVSPDMLRSAAGTSDADISEAVHELEQHGLIYRHVTLGMGDIGFTAITPMAPIFTVFDPIFGMGDPKSDSQTLATELTQNLQGTAIDELATRLGWLPRRMNPALSILLEGDLLIASSAMDRDWVARWVRPKPGLRTFAKDGCP